MKPKRTTTNGRSIQIKNPCTLALVAREMAQGAGRNLTETAENLITEAAGWRLNVRSESRITAQQHFASPTPA